MHFDSKHVFEKNKVNKIRVNHLYVHIIVLNFYYSVFINIYSYWNVKTTWPWTFILYSDFYFTNGWCLDSGYIKDTKDLYYERSQNAL